MPDRGWVDEFVTELTRTYVLIEVEAWADERQIIVHGGYRASGKPFV